MIEIPVGDKVDWSSALSSIRVARMKKVATLKVAEPRPCSKESWPPNYDLVLEWRRKKLAQIESGRVDPLKMRAAYARGWQGAVRFICHWMDTYDPRNAGTNRPVWMPMILFPKQVELVRFVMSCLEDQEGGLLEKSRTMGASWVCINLSIWMWLFWPGSAIGWGSQSQEQVDRIGDMSSLFEKMRQSIARLPDVWKPEKLIPEEHLLMRRLVNPDNGSTITGGIGDKIGRGGRTRVYFKDESAHYERPDIIEASLSETTRVPIDISSVNGTGNLFHRTREAGVDWTPNAKDLPKGQTRVLVMDWSDHPEYDLNWYLTKEKAAKQRGIRHIFAQEIERNYAAAVEGVIIQPELVEMAVDAHEVLGFEIEGGIVGALDVADGLKGVRDRNAWAGRWGSVLVQLDEWAERDTAMTARKAVVHGKALMELASLMRLESQYDCIGVGAGVKAETNRLKDKKSMPLGMTFIPWNAGSSVLYPLNRPMKVDDNTPDAAAAVAKNRNKDLFENLKAQGWWNLQRRFELTYRAVMKTRGTPLEGDEDLTWEPGQLISLSSKHLPNELLLKLKKELSQPVWTQSGRLRMMVDKTPEGTTSPNMGDVVMMAFWPIPADLGLLATSFAGPIIVPIKR